jgi:autotransporter-associated beta strand protein
MCLIPARVPRVWVALICLLVFAGQVPAQLTFNLTYSDTGTGVGFDDPIVGATRRATMTAAANYIASQLDARGTININFDPSNTQNGQGFLGQMGTSFIVSNGFSNGLVFQRATTNSTPFAPPDGSGFFNFANDVNWNNGLAPPAFTQFDLFSVALHEFTHALGFSTRFRSTGQGFNQNPLGSLDVYSTYDKFIKRGSTDQFLLNQSSASFNTAGASPADLTSNDLFFDGAISRAANGGNPVKVYAPSSFAQASSISHVDDSGPSNAVMRRQVTNGTTRREYLNFELAMLIDFGWNTYTWTSTNGNWADNVASTTNSRWQNIDGQNMLSPVGSITPNVVLKFGGGSFQPYTSTNNLPANPFQVMRVVLDSLLNSPNTNTIAGSRLQFGTSIGVQPQIQQANIGAFNITTPITLTAPGLELTGDGTGLVTLGGVIDGNGPLSKTGTSTFALSGANTYNGNTTVSAGTLRLTGTGSFANSPRVTVGPAAGSPAILDTTGVTGGANSVGGSFALAANQTLAGHGTVTGPVRIRNNSTVSPGTSPGTLTVNGTVTFAPNGTYEWELNSVNGSPTTQDRLTIGGTLDLSTLSPANRFTIAVTSLTPSNTPGNVSDFSNLQTYQWTLATFATLGGLFDPNLFTVNTSNFSNLLLPTSIFTVSQAGNSLFLNYAPVPEPVHILFVAVIGAGICYVRRRREVTC